MNRDDFALWLDDCYHVDSESVRSYARATRSAVVPYDRSRVLPADTPVPSLIIADPVFKASTRMMSAVIDDFDLSRVLHVAQSLRYLAPLRIGDVLTLGGRIADRVTKAGIDLFEVECVIVVDGEARVRTTSTVAYAGGADMPADLGAASAAVMMADPVL